MHVFQNIVWLTGMPRSGTNWLSQILASHPSVRLKFCPLFSYEFKNELDETASAEDWRTFFERVYVTPGDYLDQEYLRRDGLLPDFPIRDDQPRMLAIKSTRFHHLTEGLIAKCPNIRFVGIVRNPCAAIYSWISNPLEFPADADPGRQWRSGQCRKTGAGEFWGFDDWKRVTAMFLDLESRAPDRFRIVSYESLVACAREETQLLFDWLDLSCHQQTRDFLEESQHVHSKHRRSVFKAPSTAMSWKGKLSAEIEQAIRDDLAHSELRRFLEE